jgi:hypothetical protein
MSKARDISKFGDERGVGSPVSSGDPGAIFASVSTTATVTSDTNLSSGGPYIVIQEKDLHVETGINLTVGDGKNLVVDSLQLP